MAIGGKDTTWKHGTNGALTDLTNFTTKTRSVTFSAEGETIESTVFGDSYRDYEQSFKSATIEVTYKYDTTVFGQLAAIFTNSSTVSFELSPEGTAAGNAKITGSMQLPSFNTNFNIGELQEISVTFQVSGAVTFGTHS